MRNLYITIFFVLWGFAQGAVAQNMYRNYRSTWVSKPTSAVSVVHSNGYVFFFQADGSGKLSAAEIDPFYTPTAYPVSVSPDIVSVIIECDDGSNACSHQFEDKALPYSITNASPSISLSVEGSHRFVCEGFEGDIEYSLYDMTGKLLQRGTTRNGEQNVLKKSNGVYMLRATDCAGNRMTTKLILF